MSSIENHEIIELWESVPNNLLIVKISKVVLFQVGGVRYFYYKLFYKIIEESTKLKPFDAAFPVNTPKPSILYAFKS